MADQKREAHQHTDLGDMAHECAQHHGTMIVDIDIEPNGRKHIHAVATWEEDELDHQLAQLADDGWPHPQLADDGRPHHD